MKQLRMRIGKKGGTGAVLRLLCLKFQTLSCASEQNLVRMRLGKEGSESKCSRKEQTHEERLEQIRILGIK